MARKLVEANCFLCETPTHYFEFDGGKRRHYACTGVKCGEYIITDTARRRLDVPHAGSWRLDAAGLARKVSNEERLLEIWVNPSTHVLETHLVNRETKVGAD